MQLSSIANAAICICQRSRLHLETQCRAYAKAKRCVCSLTHFSSSPKHFQEVKDIETFDVAYATIERVKANYYCPGFGIIFGKCLQSFQMPW